MKYQLLLALAMTIFPASMTAMVTPSDTVHRLESVSVTASRAAMTLGTSARIVTVMDSMAIATIPAQTVNDLLKYVAGVDVRQRGSMGMQTDISMRGGTFDQIAILLNGINISDPHTGHNAADFPVSIAEIERIEVLEGPSARVYGTSSLVGAINIVTKKPGRVTSTSHVQGGSYGFMSAGTNYGWSAGRFKTLMGTSYSCSDGYSRNKEGRLNSDFRGEKTFLSTEYSSAALDISLQGGLSYKDFGSNTFYSAKYDDQFEHTLKSTIALQAQTKGDVFRFKPAVYWNRGEDRFELIRNNPDKVPFNFHRTSVLGVNLGADLITKAGTTSFGAEMRNEDIISTNLGEPLFLTKGDHYVCGLNRTNVNAYLDHSLILSRFTISGGVTAVMNSTNGTSFGLYPGLDMSWRFSDDWKLYASYNSSFRLPTFTELYYSVGGHKADPNLKPERMQSIEGGLKYLKPGISAVLSAYYHHGSQMIDWIKDFNSSDDPYWESVNHTSINTIGEELSVRVDFPVLLGLESFPLSKIDIAYSHIDQDKALQKGIESRYALEYLRNKLVAGVDIRLPWNLTWNVSVRWQDRVGSYEKYDSTTPTGVIVGYQPYTLLDSKLFWVRKSYKVFIEADNILNKVYYDFGNIPQPGIWFRIGTVYTVNI